MAFTIFITVFLALVGAIWKCSSLRGEVNDKYRQDIKVTKARLSQNASNCLIQLNKEISEEIDPDGEEFNPEIVVADPAKLKDLVDKYLLYLSHRESLEPAFRKMLKIGPFLLICLTPMLLAWIAYGVQLTPYAITIGGYNVNQIELAVFGVFILLGGVAMIYRLYLLHVIDEAKIVSEDGAMDD